MPTDPNPWKSVGFWLAVLVAAPFVLIYVAHQAARRRIWAGKIYLKGVRRGIR